MPNLDKTGPEGKGPTGMGHGGCKDPEVEEKNEGTDVKDDESVEEE